MISPLPKLPVILSEAQRSRQIPRAASPLPLGLRLLGITGLVLAAILAVQGTLAALGVASMFAGAFLLEGVEVMGALIYFLSGALLLTTGTGLLRRWRWSRHVFILLAAVEGVGAIPGLSTAVMDYRILSLILEGAKVVLMVVTIRYLFQPAVIKEFQR